MKAKPINPHRLRRIPPHFSWIDHRVVRQGYVQRCGHAALSLYLFYLTVADAQGMSYYADLRLMTTLSMTQPQLNNARHCLITQNLIAYAAPFVQVLSLDEAMTAQPRARHTTHPKQTVNPAPLPTNQEKAKTLIKTLRDRLRSPQ